MTVYWILATAAAIAFVPLGLKRYLERRERGRGEGS